MKFNLTFKNGWAVVALPLCMAGCGGGGGSSAPTVPVGILPHNVIFYADSSNTTPLNYNYWYIAADGSGNTAYASLNPDNYQGLAFNSASTKKFFAYRADTSSAFGIYQNSSVSITGATNLVPPSYDNIVSLQTSQDESTLYFIASSGTADPVLYKLSLTVPGSPIPLDTAFDGQVNAAGNQVVYSKLVSGNLAIFVRGTNATDTPTQITHDSFDDDFPQWNRAGTKIAYSAKPSGLFDIYTMNADGTSVTQVTNTPTADEHTPSFNDSGNALSFVSLDNDPSKSGLFTVSLGSSTDLNRKIVKLDADILDGTYWSSSNGRSVRSSRTSNARNRKKLP